MDKTFHFTVNGQARTVTTDPERPLLEVLRADLQLTGPKRGCGAGKCRPPLERFWV
jgi:aerobic-type carbon monoxide dehydrogenase small subunit (CoxS/CutS family)